MTEPTTSTLHVPGAVLVYDVRRNPASSEPPLLLIASPMGAAGFVTLSSYFTDRTVVTYDPRGVERSERTDGATTSTTEEHADDVHRLISALDTGPVDIFASSGGAMNALALVGNHPEQVRVLVAHEPPIDELLPDRDAARAAFRAVHDTYVRKGFGAGLAHFIALTSHKGPFSDDWANQPAPDPATFGLPTEDDGSRDDPLLGPDPEASSHYVPDLEAIRSSSTRVVIAAGAESEGELTYRAAIALAERLGLEPVIFPSHHAGFLGGEYAQTGDPSAFAAKLREVLRETVARPALNAGATGRALSP